jgi:2-polyprenyl-6-hydroxyphenyl methylase/3-demethylubiquinone-9 3-methyltransferase
LTLPPKEVHLRKETTVSGKVSNADLYGRLGENWRDEKAALNSLHAMHPVTLGFFMRAVGDKVQGTRLLDAGCGGGLLSETFSRAGALVTGIDVRPGAIETARQHATRVGLNINCQVGSLENLGFPGESFDVVVASFVLEHVPDLHVAARNVVRVLKLNGMFLFSGINRTLTALFIVSIGFQYIPRKISRGTLRWNKFVRPG